MNLKTVTASSMAEALAVVRREMGASAVILHTRQYKRGGFLGLGARNVVEVTAADGKAIAKRNAANVASRRKSLAAAVAAKKSAAPVIPPQQPNAGDLIRRTYAAARAEMTPPPAPPAPAPEVVSPTPSAARGLAPSPPSPPAPDTSAELTEEMRTVKRMVERMMASQSTEPQQRDLPDNLFDQYMSLLKQEVTQELADEVVQEVRNRLSADHIDDDKAVREALLDTVAELMPSDDGVARLEPTADGRPRTIALIGPTGVGKTTTIAKLAATFKLRYNKNVALVTLDTYRIAAVEQLRTYANIIGLPLHVAAEPSELQGILRKTAGCDVVLIDTAGRSQKDDPRLEQLRDFINVADPHEVHLVLSSTCTQSVLLDIVKRFSAVRTDRIIFTKLDEAVSFGVLFNVIRTVNKQLSFITTGQEVPHQIEVGESKRLASLLLGEEV